MVFKVLPGLANKKSKPGLKQVWSSIEMVLARALWDGLSLVMSESVRMFRREWFRCKPRLNYKIRTQPDLKPGWKWIKVRTMWGRLLGRTSESVKMFRRDGTRTKPGLKQDETRTTLELNHDFVGIDFPSSRLKVSECLGGTESSLYQD